MSNTAFICPLYDMKNHFDLALNLYKSKIEYGIDSDFIFIFSNEEQKNKFAFRAKNELDADDILYSIMPDELLKYKAKAVTKKMYGLKEFMNKYDYIIITDCEAEFVRNFDADEVAEEIWNSRNMLVSNISPNNFFVMRECYKQMGLYYNKKLRRALGGFLYNFWFNELQVYKCSYLPDFFDWLNKFDAEKIYNTWHCFEYYVFYAYLCLAHDVQIKRYKYISLNGINEVLFTFNVKKQEKIFKNMQFHWTTSDKIKSEKICMLYHLDRAVNDVTKQNIFYKFVYKSKYYIRILLYFIKRFLILINEFPEYIREINKQ